MADPPSSAVLIVTPPGMSAILWAKALATFASFDFVICNIAKLN
jgi:hypothetical protein